MHKKIFFTLTIFTFFFFYNCNNFKNPTGFSVKGELKNYAKQKLFLEEINLGEPAVTVDTTITDGDGEFNFKGNVREKSMYRIRLENNMTYFFVLDKNEQIKFSCDIQNPLVYEVTGSTESVVLKKLIDNIQSNNLKLTKLQSQYIELQKSGAGDSVKTNFKKNADAEVESYKQQIRTFIDTTHYNLAAMFAVSLLQPEKDVEVVNKLSERLQKTAPDSKYTKAYLKRYGNIVEDLVGKHFKEIELPGFDKKFKKLSSLKGKWILLDFWASWCPPCRRENPNVVAIYKKYKAKNFTIFSVSLDDNDGKWYDAAKADHLEWANHVSELKGWESKVCKDYYINQIPTNFLINPDGIIVARDLHGEDLMKALEENVK